MHTINNLLYINSFQKILFFQQNVSLIYPVMVWIHGGAFSLGSSFMYQPEFLIAESVIVVTLNYRLGALGMYTED